MSDAMMIGDTAMRSLWSDLGDDEGHWPADGAGTSLPTWCVNLGAYPYEVRGETYHEGLSVSLRREPGDDAPHVVLSLPRPADAVLSLAEAGRLADVLHELIELTRAAEQA
jgi:hypothetical protein